MRRTGWVWVAAAWAAVATGPAAGQTNTYRWVGGSGTGWITPSNWQFGVRPSPGAGTTIMFDSFDYEFNGTSYQNLGDPFVLGKLDVKSDSRATLTIDGNPLQFLQPSPGQVPSISSTRSVINTRIDLNETFTGGVIPPGQPPATLNVFAGVGGPQFNGPISGDAGKLVFKTGNAVLNAGVFNKWIYVDPGATLEFAPFVQGSFGARPEAGTPVFVSGTLRLGEWASQPATAIELTAESGGVIEVGTSSISNVYLTTLGLNGTGRFRDGGASSSGIDLQIVNRISAGADAAGATITLSNNARVLNAGSAPVEVAVADNPAAAVELEILARMSRFGAHPAFRKTGAGTLRLTNPLNTADFILQDGTLRVDDWAHLGSGAVQMNGGTLRYGGPLPSSLTKPLDFTANGGTIYVTGGELTLAAVPTGATPGPLGKDGGGTLTLGVAIPNSGVRVDAGVFKVTAANQLPAAVTLTVNGDFNLNGFAQTAGRLEGTGDLLLGTGGALTLSGSSSYPTDVRVSGGGSVTKAGSNTLTVNTPWTHTGGTTIAAGTLRAGAVNVLPPAGTVTLSGGIFNLNGFDQTVGRLTDTGGPTTVQLGSATLTIGANNASSTYGGSIVGTGGLTKVGTGTFTLTNTNGFTGGLTVRGGTVSAASDAYLGRAGGGVTVGPAGTLRFTNSTTTNRTFDLNGGSIAVDATKAVVYGSSTINGDFGSTINGGFLKGFGTHNITGATLNGVTVQPGTLVATDNRAALNNVTMGGTMSLRTFLGAVTWDGGVLTSSGNLTVAGQVNVSQWNSNGQIDLPGNPSVSILRAMGNPLILGGGSVTNVGTYNQTTGAVTPGGRLEIGSQDLVIKGGLVRNNGTITGTTGRIVVDFGGLLLGNGTNDVDQIVLVNGGQRRSGNSPGLSRNRNLDLTNGGPTIADMSNVTGVAGSGNPAGFSGWGVYEYGATSPTTGRATITGTPASKAIYRMATVTDAPPRNTPAPAANFNPAQAYSWVVVRPGTEAGFNTANDPAKFNDFRTVNTAARINIFDPTLGQDVPLTDANLNLYLRFDDSGWDWGTTPVAQRGTFAFDLMTDTLGNPDRLIALTYTPVPEPGLVLLLAAAAVGVVAVRRRLAERGGSFGSVIRRVRTTVGAIHFRRASMSRFTMAKAVCAMVGLFGLAVLAPAQDRKDAGEALKKDAESLQGKWERAASSEAGPLARATRAVKEVKGDKETVTWYGANGEVVRSHRITFKLSQDGSVRVFTYSDPEILDGPGKGAKLTATGSYIYRLDGNELVEVGGMRAGERVAPYLARWKKVDAQAPAAGRKAVVVEGDMKAAQGVWTFDSQEAGGVRIPADPLKELTLTLDGDTFTVKAGGMVVQAGTQKFDATKTPKTVDATVTQGQGKGTIMLGIYELDGDTLKICFDPEGKTRPTEFKAAAGSATFVNVHKRVKK